VVKHPWRGKESHTTLKGKIPPNFRVVTGPGSAARTAVLLYGEPPSRKVMVDLGIVDVNINPAGRGIKLTFTGDIEQKTTGDITLGQGIPSISRRTPSLSPKVPRLK